MTSQYRPEIDGLRAVAIMPVVLFHFGLPGVSGGFVGVDVFFVISGFLIGGLLWSELVNTGRVRLGHFFLRRIRRLAPAYFAMVIASLVAGWFVLLPFEFREFGKELIAATVYLSNVFFWQGAGYFDVLGEERVLLHTWSLAVEEQFYVFLPLFLLVFAWLKRALAWLLLLLALGSLVACIIVTQSAHTTAFYLFPFRAWELLTGVLLAVYGRQTGFGWRIHGSLSWIGLGLIALAIVLLEPGASFPGFAALLPVTGAALLIANGGHENPVNRLLVTGAFRFLGLISYSLYLWHWPILTLATYFIGEKPDPGLSAALIAASVLMAWLSLKFVETPVRRGNIRGLALFAGYAVSSAVTLGLGALVYLNDGLIGRFSPDARPVILATRGFHQDWSRCRTPSDGVFAGVEICPLGPDGPPRLLIWGDSHGRAFKEGLEQAAHDAGVPAIIIWRGGCPPLVGLAKTESVTTRAEDEACTRHNSTVAAALASQPSLEAVLLIGRWTYYAEGRGVGRGAADLITLAPAATASFTGADAPALLDGALRQTVDAVRSAGLDIFVLRQVPELIHFSAREAARALAYGQQSLDEISRTMGRMGLDEIATRTAAVAPILARLDAPVIDSWPPLCSPTDCRAFHGGQVYYFDNNHLTNTGAIALRGIFAPVFGAAKGEGS